MKKWTVILPIVLFVSSLLIMLPCDKELYCYGPFSSYVAYPGLWFLALIPLSLFALVLNNEKHKIWLIFTGVFFVASMVLVFITPEYGSGIVSIDRELVNWFLAGLYSIISIIYFTVHFLKSRKPKSI